MSSTVANQPLEIVVFPMLSDNYGFLIHDPASGATAVVDPAEAAPTLAACTARGWRLTHILNTHHHGDHVGGKGPRMVWLLTQEAWTGRQAA